MGQWDHILAKSGQHGGVPLEQHLRAVANVAMKIAANKGLDENIAYKGAILHDIGKVSTQFQKTLVRHFKRPPGFIFRHEIASLFFLSLIEEKDKSIIIDMVVAHHKSIYNDAGGMGILDLIDTVPDCVERHLTDFDGWIQDALDILDHFGFPVKSITKENATKSFNEVVEYCENKQYGYSTWKGLLIAADHLASAANNELYKISDKLFIKPDLRFYNRAGEQFPLSLIAADDKRKHTIVKACTGSGKTDFLFRRCRGRVFYILPFQASINAMYERVKKDLSNTDAEVHLLHAASALKMEGKQMEEKILQRHIGASVKVLTPHQLASLVFGTKGYEALIADLSNCDIILDEIHTYAETTQAIVLKIVEILCALNCSVHIGTATMPTVLYDRLLHILGGKAHVYEVTLPSDVLDTFNRHIIHKADAIDDLSGVIENAIEEEQKILIVCNRVTRSQQLFNLIESKYPEVDKILIHSKFKRGRRNELETMLKEELNESKNACIVVATQVIEVSLDISFDLMITDAAPIDALIQRFGRINRKRNVIGYYKPVYVLKPASNKREALPYKLSTLQKSFDVLPDGDLLEEKKLQGLIDRVYPEIEFINIDLNTVFKGGKWCIKELWHHPKSALLEMLDIDSVTCIIETDVDAYNTGNYSDQRKLEIPVSYRSIKHNHLDQLKTGTRPFIISEKSYSNQLGITRNYVNNHYRENIPESL